MSVFGICLCLCLVFFFVFLFRLLKCAGGMNKLQTDFQASEQKVVIVTGGNAGIGLATVCQFLEEGAYVISVDRSHEDYSKTYMQQFYTSGNYHQVQYDFAVIHGIKTLARQIFELCGRRPIDVLVINHAMFTFGKVGIPGTGSETQTDRNVSVARWHETFDVNVVSYAKLIEAVFPFMEDGGAIVTLCSTGSFDANAENICYNASKAAVAHLTRCAAKDLAQCGVRVNGVAPGSILTQASLNHMRLLNMSEKEGKKRFAAESPLNRQGTPEEIADVISFLASEKAGFIVGQIITVDGGALL